MNMNAEVPTDDIQLIDKAKLAEIEKHAEALKGVEHACDITHAKPEFVDYIRYCHPAAVLAMAATIRGLIMRLAEVEAERDRLRDEVERTDANITERAARLSAQVVIDGAIDDYSDRVLALLDEKAAEWAGSWREDAARELKTLVEKLETK